MTLTLSNRIMLEVAARVLPCCLKPRKNSPAGRVLEEALPQDLFILLVRLDNQSFHYIARIPMTADFDAAEFASNPEPRCPCVLLLDTSGSMDGERITALNAGLVTFRDELDKDELAVLRVEVAVVSFGDRAQVVQDFVTADQFVPPTLIASGQTPMGEGIELALNLIEQRKRDYKTNGVAYYRPWVFLITDGAPTDGNQWQQAAERVHAMETSKKVAFFAVGVSGANMGILARIASPSRQPVTLDGLRFQEMFQWLSSSMSSVSRAQIDADVPLQAPIGWGKV